MKGEDVRLLLVADLTIVAEYFVICTATSGQHARSIAEEIQKRLREGYGLRSRGMEADPNGWWILLDFGDIICHVFQRDAREYYAIDDTWADAAVVDQSGHEAA